MSLGYDIEEGDSDSASVGRVALVEELKDDTDTVAAGVGSVKELNAEANRSLWQRREELDVAVFLDFEFVVADKWTRSEESFRVSRAIMAMTCDAFKRMFTSSMQESTTGRMRVDDCSTEGFSLFLGCMYGVQPELDVSNVVSLLQVADKYLHKEVSQLCRAWIRQFLDDCDADGFVSLMLALKRNALADDHLEEYTKAVARMGTELFDATNFHLLPEDVVKAMLKNCLWECETQEHVFERCIEWAKRQMPAAPSLDDDTKTEEELKEDAAADVSTKTESPTSESPTSAWIAPMKRLIASIRIPLMSVPFLFEHKEEIEQLLGTEGLVAVLFEREGYPRKKAFEIWSPDWISRTPKIATERKFTAKAVKKCAFICSEVRFDEYPLHKDVRFAFEVKVVDIRGTIDIGVAADISQFKKCEPIDTGEDLHYQSDCWLIAANSTKVYKRDDELQSVNRAQGREWRKSGSVVKVEMVYKRQSRTLRFKVWVQRRVDTLIYDFDIKDWADSSVFCPFLCLGLNCSCEVVVMR